MTCSNRTGKAGEGRRRTTQSGIVAALIVLAASHAWAQQAAPARPNDPALIAAAKAEGSVTLYGSSSVDALQSDADKFRAAYGIPVTYTQLVSGPLVARVDQEIAAGGMRPDAVINGDIAAMQKWGATGVLAPLPSIGYPGADRFTAPIQVVYQGIFYNTSAMPGPPKTWKDLLDPRFAGKIVIGSPRISPGFSTLYYALWKDPQYGRPFFEKLAAAGARLVQSPTLVAQTVASGEATLGFTALPYEAVNVKVHAPDAPIDYRYLDVVTVVPTDIGINAKAAHPKAAELFARWMMSPEGQIAHDGNNRSSSVLGDLQGTLKSPDVANVRSNVTVTQVSAEYRDLIAMFDTLFK